MTTDIVFDTDPGHDDAIALLLAAGADAIDVNAVTTVAGNQTLENTTRNARQLLTLIDRPDIPVGRGMGQPLARDLTIAPEVHGESGLDGPDMPTASVELDERHGVDLLIDTVRSKDGVTVVPVGPLTNIADGLRRAPDIVDGIDEIVLMGGAIAEGNKTPAAEFNIYVDPEAARTVFESGLPITMVGLDVTHESRVTPEEVERLRAMDNRVGTVVAELLDFAGQYYRDTYGYAGYPIHDAVAVAQVIDDRVLETETMRVDVETRGEFTAGRTVCDVVGVVEDREPNAAVGTELDRDRFMDLLMNTIEAY
jgi:inosine-uridine nucleoside N-ribohydrolase